MDVQEIEHLVSALAVMIGWESFIVLFDVRGLDQDQARQIVTGSAPLRPGHVPGRSGRAGRLARAGCWRG
jgi:hypothetical protein